MSVKLGDVWRIYFKPSLDGRIVARKKTTHHKSEFVKKSKERVANTKIDCPPAKLARTLCAKAGHAAIATTYVAGSKKWIIRCDVKKMKSYLATVMKTVHEKGGKCDDILSALGLKKEEVDKANARYDSEDAARSALEELMGTKKG